MHLPGETGADGVVRGADRGHEAGEVGAASAPRLPRPGAPVGRLQAEEGGPVQAEPAGGTPQELGRGQLGDAQGQIQCISDFVASSHFMTYWFL